MYTAQLLYHVGDRVDECVFCVMKLGILVINWRGEGAICECV